MNARANTNRRSFSLEPTRQVVDDLDAMIARHRESWPLDLIPDWMQALIDYRETAVAILRDGRLTRCAEVCNASD